MERLSVKDMNSTTRFIVTCMLWIWHEPYDATDANLNRFAGINFEKLEEIMQDAWIKIGEPLNNPKYYAFYESDDDTIQIVLPMLNRNSVWTRALFREIQKVWSMYSFSKIELRYNDIREARDQWRLIENYDSFLTSGYSYSIVISYY